MTSRYSIACAHRDGGCGHDWIAETPAGYADRCPECGHLPLTNFGRLVVEAAEATPDVIDAAIDAADFYPPPETIDWDDLLRRIEANGRHGDGTDVGWSFGDNGDSPAISKIKREVRRARREADQ